MSLVPALLMTTASLGSFLAASAHIIPLSFPIYYLKYSSWLDTGMTLLAEVVSSSYPDPADAKQTLVRRSSFERLGSR